MIIIVSIIHFIYHNLLSSVLLTLFKDVDFHFQIDVAFLRAARAGNLEKVINFLNDGGDIHTCNAVSIVKTDCLHS